MRYSPLLAAAFCLMAAPALADDDYGAYLFKGTCGAYAPASVVKDVGDLDLEDDAAKEWARLSPDKAPAPSPIRVEDESTDRVTPAQLAEGGFAIAVTGTDARDARLIACGEIPRGATLPFVGDLAEVNGSGVVGRVAIETHKKGVKITTAAYAKGAAPALRR